MSGIVRLSRKIIRKYLDTTPRETSLPVPWVGAVYWEYVRQEVYGKGTTIKQVNRIEFRRFRLPSTFHSPVATTKSAPSTNEDASLTIFTFGYWGWGNATRELIQTVDEVERSRGYASPIFVDIRIHRAVRAMGFCGEAFAATVGTSRYKWLKSLGNLTTGGPGVAIKDPEAVCPCGKRE